MLFSIEMEFRHIAVAPTCIKTLFAYSHSHYISHTHFSISSTLYPFPLCLIHLKTAVGKDSIGIA